MRRLKVLLVAVALTASSGACTSGPDAPPDSGLPLPNSMAAIGDSITRALLLGRRTVGESPAQSWSTGGGDDDINSHYERLLKRNPAIRGRAHNEAVSGARMSDAAGQAAQAVARRVDYVTVLMGANDVCASDMTPVETFTEQFRAAMETVTTGLPEASVYVVSIPDVHRLWELFHDNPAATAVWSRFGICRPVLGGSDADRQAARQRTIDFNTALRDTCAGYPRCRYDGGAVFDHRFGKDDVSDGDYFHPSREGQQTLASISWRRGYWPRQ